MADDNQETQSPPQDAKAQDKVALRASQAGMRFIAQTHIYNSSAWERLAQFIADSYHPDQLELQAAEGRLSSFKTTQEKVGRWKVKQVVAAHEHRAVVVVEVERGDTDFFLVDVVVEADYPHRITAYNHRPMTPTGSN